MILPLLGTVYRPYRLAGTCRDHSKFERSTTNCNKDMKGSSKYKNSRFEPPFVGLRSTAERSSMARWKAHRRLPISDN